MLTVARAAVNDLEPHPQNPRQGDVGAISQSLEAHGQYRPLVVQSSTSHVLAGNHTLAAARALGWAEVDVVYLDVTDDEAVRILLADNRTSDLGSYDDRVLADLLVDLAHGGELTGTGWDGDALDDLLHDLDTTHRALGPSDADLSEKLGAYSASELRQFVLTLPMAEFTWAALVLREVMRRDDQLDSITAAFVGLLRDWADREEFVPDDVEPDDPAV